ncbi:MAG: sugar ABC transporter ATP-binding protein [Collimonas pratensis]|uniref:sugar ABC transporter ATP-binding protein n=1 Tax=Collimonas pratensis TaxID=279113 RepID=UPI003C7962A7
MMDALVSVRNIVKRFAGTVALSGVSFDILPSEVHVLLGENGAGKSTLMKILSGIYEPSEGEIQLSDTVYSRLTPMLSKNYGIALIYQELSVIDYLSIEENLFVGVIPTRKVFGIPVVDRALMHRKAVETLLRVGLNRNPRTLVGDLSISEKQQVEIAKALASDARVIIMDEPTSSLTDEEVRHLFKVIGELKQAGIGIVYISHKLKEIAEIGDRVSVLKDGKHVGTFDAKTTPTRALIASMVGREIDNTRPDSANVSRSQRVLQVHNLSSVDGRVKDVSFELYHGEILGFAGLMGSGRSELMEVIFGARQRSAGSVTLAGRDVTVKTPYYAVKAGMAFVTEDRRLTGFFHNFSIAENISIVSFLRTAKRQISLERFDRPQERRFGQQYMQRLRIRCSSPDQNITELSGGNQQKAIIAKWLAAECELFIFDEPTRGIDIGAKAEIYQIMRELADAGKSILMVSSELPELLGVCDRIAVYKEGGIAEILDNRDATEEEIMRIAMA